MKKTKKLLSIIALLFCLPFAILFTGCNNTPPAQVSAKDVVKQSITKMESIIYQSTTQNLSTPLVQKTSFSMPNTTLNMTQELISIMRGSGISLYFSDYMLNKNSNIKVGVVYKDEVTQTGVSDFVVHFKLSEISNGIVADFTNSYVSGGQTLSSNIKTYFIYDYTLNKPLETIIISSAENRIAIAKFDYSTETAYAYEIILNSENAEFANKLTNKTLDYTAFKSLDLASYKIIKINKTEKKGYSYNYRVSETIDVTDNELSSLYTEVYNKVKDYADPTTSLDTTSATTLDFYKNMYIYASMKSSVLANGENIVDTYINYSTAKSLLNQIKTKLNEDYASNASITSINTELDGYINFINSINENTYVGAISEDLTCAFLPSRVVNSTSIEYYVGKADGTQLFKIVVENANLKSLELV